jgi:quinone-modifying oxidoreductase subunit QmoC
MIWALWGLKDQLFGDPDIWLCHQCGDCSKHCPRGAKPADVLSALRQLSYQHYARPAILGKLLSKPAWLPLAILVPVLVISIILLAAGTLHIPEGKVIYSKFFPHAWLNSTFTLITLAFYSFAWLGLRKFYNDMKRRFPEASSDKSFLHSFIQATGNIMLHNRFSGCVSQRSRKTAHLLVFYGFVMLLFVTVYAIVAATSHRYPLSFENPFKIAGNLAGLMLLTGLGIIISKRIFHKKEYGNTSYSDWMLLIPMLLLTLSGGVVELARFQNWQYAYHLYFFHLVCVWFVIMYLPFGKFGHMLYRTVAMTFAISINRN